jgi:hypothetical protein
LLNPLATLGVVGVIAKAVKVASVMVCVAVADCSFDNESIMDAVIVEEPGITPMAIPLVLIVATAESSDDQVTELVISDDVPSE